MLRVFHGDERLSRIRKSPFIRGNGRYNTIERSDDPEIISSCFHIAQFGFQLLFSGFCLRNTLRSRLPSGFRRSPARLRLFKFLAACSLLWVQILDASKRVDRKLSLRFCGLKLRTRFSNHMFAFLFRRFHLFVLSLNIPVIDHDQQLAPFYARTRLDRNLPNETARAAGQLSNIGRFRRTVDLNGPRSFHHFRCLQRRHGELVLLSRCFGFSAGNNKK